jgi:hypothetical protein
MWPFKRRTHKADEYFRHKLRERMSAESSKIVWEARSIRHQYPDLSGPELVRLVYWGASGTPEPA